MKELRIIYMGTPEFAVPSLELLITSGYNVVAVVTTPDKPAGRGLKLTPSPVKECALKYNIPVLQPEKLKAPEFIEELKSYNANLQIVVAFRMLPEIVWNMPVIGTFNLHASLLPQYRGAAPVNWAIINGEKETGCTTFFLQHEIDTGDILFQEKEPIHPDDNIGTLYERMMHNGAKLVLKTVQAIEQESVHPIPQSITEDLKKAPKIFKETCLIDWNQTATQVHNLIRGLSPYPVAWTTINNKSCKIFSSQIVENSSNKAWITDSKSYLHVRCTDQYISVLELQIEGKKRMDIKSFLAGNSIEQIDQHSI